MTYHAFLAQRYENMREEAEHYRTMARRWRAVAIWEGVSIVLFAFSEVLMFMR